MRATVDTNIWVSALISKRGAPARIRVAFENQRFTLIMSQPMLAELEDVLLRPRFAQRFGITPADMSELLDRLRDEAELVEVTGTIAVCRDPDDDMVIETAVVGGADVLVTGDADLGDDTEVARYLAERGIEVWNVTRFMQALDEEEAEDR